MRCSNRKRVRKGFTGSQQLAQMKYEGKKTMQEYQDASAAAI